ncbi:MAG: SGNH/GDSL hydrolase family protein [Lachnospiraceae bacterium]|nr:SGNH/GDSL hydrolase family protein [Lachnospiraceae bacterium]
MGFDRKNLLCYGDSNTYGYNPANGFRYPEDVRWTGILQNMLGTEYKVIEEGCNGRTTIFDDPIEGWKNGRDYLKPCLNSHKPIDYIIMMLGSNDLKDTFHATAKVIADGAGVLVRDIINFSEVKQGYVPKIILTSPPEIGEEIKKSPFYGRFYEDAIERSREFPKYYKNVAEDYGCIFINAASYVKPSTVDSLHLSPEGHKKLAEVFYEAVKNL